MRDMFLLLIGEEPLAAQDIWVMVGAALFFLVSFYMMARNDGASVKRAIVEALCVFGALLVFIIAALAALAFVYSFPTLFWSAATLCCTAYGYWAIRYDNGLKSPLFMVLQVIIILFTGSIAFQFLTKGTEAAKEIVFAQYSPWGICSVVGTVGVMLLIFHLCTVGTKKPAKKGNVSEEKQNN